MLVPITPPPTMRMSHVWDTGCPPCFRRPGAAPPLRAAAVQEVSYEPGPVSGPGVLDLRPAEEAPARLGDGAGYDRRARAIACGRGEGRRRGLRLRPQTHLLRTKRGKFF